jgi:hypothetical protein
LLQDINQQLIGNEAMLHWGGMHRRMTVALAFASPLSVALGRKRCRQPDYL